MPDDIKRCHATNRKQWRAWLERNHGKETKVWLINHKRHTGKPALSHRESMEEAICFGWIDTIARKLDEDTFTRCFVRRGKNSRWSTNTLSYAKQLIKEGRMTEEGMKRYQEGLKKPVIDSGIGKNPEVPPELERALSKNRKAKAFFDSLAPSYRRIYILFVLRAKRPETKKKWAAFAVRRCAEGKKPMD